MHRSHARGPRAVARLACAALALAAPLVAACATTDRARDLDARDLDAGHLDAVPPPDAERVVLAVHGGAGTLRRAELTPELEADYRAALERALRAGHAVLAAGGGALDAVCAAVTLLEDDPLFNAGVGAVLTAAGTCELDASLMHGARRAAGAVAGVRTVEHPILAARAVLEHSPHVLLAGEGAERFAAERGLDLVRNEHFRTERRVRQLERMRAEEGAAARPPPAQARHGTVGCVALDRAGHLAAGTSTGGMANKRWGRVGDSPIVGAGVWADDRTCAVSSTGWGEYFLRGAVAARIASRMDLAGQDVAAAAHAVVHGELTEAGGTGGVIALDREGRLAMPFNTEGMYRGWIDRDGRVTVEIYGDE